MEKRVEMGVGIEFAKTLQNLFPSLMPISQSWIMAIFTPESAAFQRNRNDETIARRPETFEREARNAG